MKKLFVVTIVLTLLAVMVMPALAAGPNRAGKAGKAPFELSGVITGLDPEAGTVTVMTASGNKLVKPYLGQTLTIQTTASTRFLLRNPDGAATPITFAELVVGQKASLQGTLADGVWTATRITVGAKLIRLP